MSLLSISRRLVAATALALPFMASELQSQRVTTDELVAATRASSVSGSSADVGVLVVAHGAGPEWNGQVEEVVAQVRTGGPVAIAYLMGPAAKTHRFQDQVAKLAAEGAREVVVVPLLVSSHSGHYEQIRYLAGQVDSLSEVMMHHVQMSGLARPAAGVPVRLTPAIDDAAQIVDVLAARAATLAPNASGKALFVIGHGPNSAEDHALWMRNLRVIADSLRSRTVFASVQVGLVRDDAPDEVRAEAVRGVRDMIEMQHALTGQDVIVVPVLIASGSVSREKLPKDLAGLPVMYTGDALLPHPAIARLIESRVAGASAYTAIVPRASKGRSHDAGSHDAGSHDADSPDAGVPAVRPSVR